ncbi:MAG: GHKL domain-containing protein [Saccharofermentanales bacterium]
MTSHGRRRIFLIIGLIMSLLIIFLPVVYSRYFHELTAAPKAVAGTLNMTSDPDRTGKLFLDGQWEFYWQRLIVSEPAPGLRPDLFAEIPGKWTEYSINGRRLTAGGFGSYRLLLAGYSSSEAITVDLPDFGGAYRVYVDGELTAESGVVSADPAHVATDPSSTQYPVMPDTRRVHEIVIETATAEFPGVSMTPILDGYRAVQIRSDFRSAVRFLLFGIVLFAFISLLVTLFTMARRKWSYLWLPILILSAILRILLNVEFYSFWQFAVFGGLPYRSTHELMYFTTFALKYLMIYIIEEQCDIRIPRRDKLVILGTYIFLYLAYLIIPNSFYNTHLQTIIPTLTYIVEFYLFIKIYREPSEMKRFSMVIYLSSVLVIIGLSLDSYYISGMILPNMSLALLICLSIFSIIMNWVYNQRVGDLYDDFALSASRLELANSQIDMQKQYYAALGEQMNEIRGIKHDIRHVVRAMQTLTDEGRIDELKRLLHEYDEKTDMERLPVFCENIIANSIIGYYYLLAKENGISLENRCRISPVNSISDSDLCVILGNMLENAIEACVRMTEGNRFISMEANTTNHHQLIRVQNSYDPSTIEKADGRLLSKKEGKLHGFGLANIEKIISSYGGTFTIEQNETAFTLMTAIPE